MYKQMYILTYTYMYLLTDSNSNSSKSIPLAFGASNKLKLKSDCFHFDKLKLSHFDYLSSFRNSTFLFAQD